MPKTFIFCGQLWWTSSAWRESFRRVVSGLLFGIGYSFSQLPLEHLSIIIDRIQESSLRDGKNVSDGEVLLETGHEFETAEALDRLVPCVPAARNQAALKVRLLPRAKNLSERVRHDSSANVEIPRDGPLPESVSSIG